MTDDDLAFYVGEFERTGFRGGLSWYRSADATFAAMGAFDGVQVEQPALFVYGELEPVLAMSPGALEAMPDAVPNLRPPVMLPGCGHWTQQERPDEVNARCSTSSARCEVGRALLQERLHRLTVLRACGRPAPARRSRAAGSR